MTQGESYVKPSGDSGQARMTFRGLLSIHEFAQICRTTPRTLRFYEQKGLFRPAKIDQNNKYRLYDPKQARDFLKIRLLQNFHLSLKQITRYVSLRGAKNERQSNPKVKEIASLPSVARNDKDGTEEYLEQKLKRIKEEINEKEKEYRFLQKIKEFLFQNDGDSGQEMRLTRQARMTNTQNIFQTQFFGPYYLFCMKVEHGEYAKINDYIKTLWKEAKRLKLECKPSEITFYFNNVYNPKNTPLETALILKGNSPLSLRAPAKQSLEIATVASGDLAMTNKNFYFKSYPKTKILSFNYTGPYEYLILIYQKLFSYIETQKVNLKGFVFETYKYGPSNTKSKYDYQTLIGFPI